MILVDVTDTCETSANTGVQRVVRSVFHALKARCDVLPVRFDKRRRVWMRVDGRFLANLSLESQRRPSSTRGRGGWLARRLRAVSSQGTLVSSGEISAARGMLFPEPFSRIVYENIADLRRKINGPIIALFHDAIPLKLPQFSNTKTLARMPSYMHELVGMDAVLANSQTSRTDLVDFWNWASSGEGESQPEVGVLTFGVDLPYLVPASNDVSASSVLPEILCVGTLERRKNHAALLEAAERLWGENKRFRLRLIGMLQRETGVTVFEQIKELQAKGRPLIWDGPVSDEALASAYRRCRFTVYPSLMEGFGIPVIESLAFGKPCICSNKGALGELAERFGGVGLPDVGVDSLHRAMLDLLERPAVIAAGVSSQPEIPTWDDCARDIAVFFENKRNEHQGIASSV